MPESRKVQAEKALDALKRAELVNLDVPVSRLADAIASIGEEAGYVLAWEKYVLVVADIADQVGNPVIK